MSINKIKTLLNKLRFDQRGQALILAMILLAVGSIVAVPLLTYMSTGLKTNKIYDTKKDNVYAADAGIEDALWRIKYNHMPTTPNNYDRYDYSTVWEWQTPGQINDMYADVTVQNIWIPKNINTPDKEAAKKIITDSKLIVTGSTIQTGIVISGSLQVSKYTITVTYYPGSDDGPLSINSLGIWLPQGYEYYSDSTHKSSLDSDISKEYYKVPVTAKWEGGQAVLWDYTAPVAFTSFPNVSAVNFPMTAEITFYFEPLNQSRPEVKPDAVAWITTSGVSDIPYSWNADVKVLKMTSTTDETAIESYVAQNDLRDLDTAVSGDYYATGNSLLSVYGSSVYRTVAHDPSSASVTSDNIPNNADVAKAYLYWSAWQKESVKTTFLSDTCSNFNNWTNGSSWNLNGSSDFKGQYTSGGEDARNLTANHQNGYDLSSYSPGTAFVTWSQKVSNVTDLLTDDCSSTLPNTKWNATSTNTWSTSSNHYRSHYAGQSYRDITTKNSLDLNYPSEAVTISWDQWVDALSTLLSDDCSSLPDSTWDATSPNAWLASNNFRGHYSSGENKDITMKNSLNLGDYSPGAVTVSWDQWVDIMSPLYSDSCSSFGNWNADSPWSVYNNYFRGHYSSGSNRDVTMTSSVDLTPYSQSGATISWDQWVNALTTQTPFYDNCSATHLTNWWQNGGDWTYNSQSGKYKGQHSPSNGADSRRYLTLNSQDLSTYGSKGTITVSWDLSKGGTLSSTDGLDFEYSLDGGNTWTSNSVFRGPNNPPSNPSYSINDVSLPGNFKIRFRVVGCTGSNQYCSIKNITIKVTPSYTEADGLDFALSSDGGSTWSSPIQAFRGSIVTSQPSNNNFTYTIPSQYFTANFKVKFSLVGCSDSGKYCNIDNIKINFPPFYAAADGVDFAFSNDNGATYCSPIEAFRGNIGGTPVSYSYTIPESYLTSSFRMKFSLVGGDGLGQYFNIDNIKITPTYSASDGLDFAFSTDSGSTWSSPIQAFRGNIGSTAVNYSYAIPSQSLNLTNNCLIKISLVGCGGSAQYVNIDNIKVTPSYTMSDGLDIALSADGGSTWSTNIKAFRGNIGTTEVNHSYCIPGQYMTTKFKVRFHLAGFNHSWQYCYIDNIYIQEMPPDTTSIFKIDDQMTHNVANADQVYFDTDGNPQTGSGSITSEKSQVLPNFSSNDPHGFSYSCRRDVTALVRSYSQAPTAPATNWPGYADYWVGGVSVGSSPEDQWAYANWSLIIIYISPDTQGHQLYLFDNSIYSDQNLDVDFDNDGQPGGTISGFIVPERITGITSITVKNGGSGYTSTPTVTITGSCSTNAAAIAEVANGHVTKIIVTKAGSNYSSAPTVTITGGGGAGATATANLDINAAKITCYSGEGDVWYHGDYLELNGEKLWDGTTTEDNSQTNRDNAFNSTSMGVSTYDGIDIDTFGEDPPNGKYITWASGLINAGDTSAQIDLVTNTDVWNMVYMILSFRSSVTTGGSIGYLIR